jgi:hypothetical protein
MNPGRGQSDQEAFGSTRCSRAERAEFYFEPFCQLAPAVNGWGFFIPNMARTQIIASSMGSFGHLPFFWTTAEV